MNEPPAVKDDKTAHPIAGAWRPMICEVVRSFAKGDYLLASGVAGVDPVSAKTADHIRTYVANYGATLIELPEGTWQTSVAQWYGSYWEILVDLWTAEEGCSDMVLHGRVMESDSGPRLASYSVFVP